MAELMCEQLRGLIGPVSDRFKRDAEDTVRWSAVHARCGEERKKRGFSIKDASAQLKIPQYRLNAIERGLFRKFEPEMAQRYFRFLGFEPWLKRWAKANPELAGRAGVIPPATGPQRHKA
jgi:hypothetical protein